jgi:hypothetical protein
MFSDVAGQSAMVARFVSAHGHVSGFELAGDERKNLKA